MFLPGELCLHELIFFPSRINIPFRRISRRKVFFVRGPHLPDSGPGHDRLPGLGARLHRLFLWVQLPKKPAAKKESRPLNSPVPLRGPGSRPAALGKLACGPGRAVCLLSHSQHSAKVAEIVATAARISRAIDPGARRFAAGIFVRALAPGLQPANIPWRLLAFRQSPRSAGSASLFRAFRQL